MQAAMKEISPQAFVNMSKERQSAYCGWKLMLAEQ